MLTTFFNAFLLTIAVLREQSDVISRALIEKDGGIMSTNLTPRYMFIIFFLFTFQPHLFFDIENIVRLSHAMFNNASTTLLL